MPAPVVVRIAVAGLSEANAALDGLGARSRKLGEQMANDNARSASRRVQNTRRATDQQLREVERWVAKSQAAEDKHTAKVEREAAKRSAAAIKAEARALNESVRAWNKGLQELRKSEQAKTTAVEREAKKRQQAEERAAKASENASRRGASKSILPGAIGRAGRSTIGTVTGVAGGLGLAAGSMMIGSAFMENIAMRQQAALLVNATRDKQGNATQTVEGLTNEAQGLAGKYGINAGDIMKGMNIVSARAGGASGLTAFRQDLEDITKTAKTFGVSMEDMGGVVAAALKADVKPGEEMRQLIQDIAAMGKDGAIEISDLASELAKLGGAARQTNLKAGDMLRRQVGLAQVAADAAVSPEESRTSIVDLMRDINTNAHHLKAAGVKIHDKQGMMNDPAQILADAMDVAMKKGVTIRGKGQVKGAEALSGLFTGTSHKIVESLLADYNKGGKAGVLARINAASGAQLAPNERDKGLATVMAGPGAQMAANMEKFKAKIGEMIPAFTALLPKLLEATQAFAKIAVWASQNPFSALGALFAGHLAKELAAAKISELIRNAFQGGGGPGGVGGIGGGKGGGVVNAIGNATAIGAMAVAGGYMGGQFINEQLSDPEEEGARLYKAKMLAQESLSFYRQKAAKGGLTEDERAQLERNAGKVGLFKAEAGVMEQDPGLNPFGMISQAAYMRGGGENAKAASFEEIQKAMQELAANAKTASAALATVQGGTLPGQTGAPTSRTPTSPLMK